MNNLKAAEYFRQLAKGEPVTTFYPPLTPPEAYRRLADKVSSPAIKAALLEIARQLEEKPPC